MNSKCIVRMMVAGLMGFAVVCADSAVHAAKHDANGDGFSDLAIGIPEKDIDSQSNDNSGAVHVIYGSADGLRNNGDQLWHQDQPGMNNSRQIDDQFGSALAWGDFNNDGFDDLAIGVPGEKIGGFGDAGAVHVLYGSPQGLVSAGDQLWHQDSPGIADHAEQGDGFGAALATGDFDGDGFDDLAIGVPEENIGGIIDAGAVHIIFGSHSGLKANGDQFFHQDTTGVLDSAEDGDLFGHALAAGDFDNDGRDDLAIGVVEENILLIDNAGAVNVLYGSNSGLTTGGDQFWHQDSPGVKDVAEDDDLFGNTLAVGDFDGDGRDDLAIGVLGEDILLLQDAGAVNVLYGSNSGLTDDGDQFWHQDSPGIQDIAEEQDRFSTAMTCGDFDGDGHADLAIGVALEDFPTIDNAGAIVVLYGSDSGLSDAGDQFLHQDTPGISDVAEKQDTFGCALAFGDFDGDGRDDLAIGAADEDIPLDVGQTITKVTVTLREFAHAYPSDVDILLVGPNGQTVLLMSDAGGDTPVGNLDFIFSDDAASALPTPLVSGLFKPTNNGAGDAFPAPAPVPSGSAALSDFIGTSPVGDWSLFIVDDFPGDGGILAQGWSLNIQAITGVNDYSTITIAAGGAALPYPSTITIEADAVRNAGCVHVIYGSNGGLSSQGDQVFNENTPGINNRSAAFDSFGSNM